MTDLGPLISWGFLMFLSQEKYAIEILEQTNMLNFNQCRNHVDTNSKLGVDGPTVCDPTLYRSLVGALQYLTFTRPDIYYIVQHICLFMHDPRETHFQRSNAFFTTFEALLISGFSCLLHQLHLLCLIQTPIGYGAPQHVDPHPVIVSFLAITCYLCLLSSNTPPRSSVEAEYQGDANAVVEHAGYATFFGELHCPLFIHHAIM
ncbi:uncharacterized protein [Rutidosis leptorrhynchoides]|uniref:uncharacterized protein n=1 Tax=Rutidosis leptorrhynchoides TaxID=125765 RepID=UPI003A998544